MPGRNAPPQSWFQLSVTGTAVSTGARCAHGSGLKTSRKGLKKLFTLVCKGKIDRVVISYKDRLTRFGFEYLEDFFRSYGVEIICT